MIAAPQSDRRHLIEKTGNLLNRSATLLLREVLRIRGHMLIKGVGHSCAPTGPVQDGPQDCTLGTAKPVAGPQCLEEHPELLYVPKYMQEGRDNLRHTRGRDKGVQHHFGHSGAPR